MATHLFTRDDVSKRKDSDNASHRGLSRVITRFGLILSILVSLLLLPVGEAQAQATWQVVTIPSLPAGAVPTGVWSSGPNDVYVSAYNPADVPQGFVFHWDGTSWSEVLSLPGHSTGKVFGTGPSDVFVVAFKCTAGSAAGCGADRGGRVFRSVNGGGTWTPQVLPAEVGVNGLGDISGTPGNVHVIAGVNYILRFNGVSWSTVFSGFSDAQGLPQALTLLSATEGYFVTCWGWGRWNGTHWTFNGIQFDFCDVNSIWGIRDGVGALHLYTAGNNNFSNGVRVWRFNEATQSFGSKFGYVFSDGSGANAGSATGIWGSGPNDIYVIGRIEPGPNNGRLYHFDGTTWQQVTVIGPIPAAHGIWGSSPGDVWVMLSNGQLLHYAPPPDTTPPVVDVSFPSSNGQNGWFVTSPVVGSVTANDTTTGGSNITDITCTGATLGSITGLGTPSATTSLTVLAEGVNNVSCSATDTASNSGAGAGSNNTATIQLDSVAPAVLIASPTDGGTYLLNQAVASSYNCTDATSGVATCSGPVVSGANFSTSSVGAHAFTVTASDVAGNLIQATNDYDVIYNFSGFFSPVDNPGPGPSFVFNVAKAGGAIPVKFSLSGDQGLNIFDTGFPVSQQIPCNASSTTDVIEQTLTAGSSSLSYDATTDQYVYVWKTNKGWANTCRKLIVQLNDGTPHVAYFTFTK